MDEHIPYQESYPKLEKALREGVIIRISRSSKGLRIVRVENENNNLIWYGGYPYLSGALAHAEHNFGLCQQSNRYSEGICPQAHDVFDQYVYNHADDELTIFYVQDKFICMRPHPEPFLEDQIIWGSGPGLMPAMCDCFINHHVEDRKFFMNRMSIQKKN